MYGENEVFGEDEVINDKPRNMSVYCDSAEGGEIIAITKNVRNNNFI